MRIYLIGFPGSGKTFVGRRLALNLGCRFLDLDDLIEVTEGMKIPEIFSSKGEEYFRKIEKNALISTSNLEKIIISTGGGTPCFHNNMDTLKEIGITIYLDTPEKILTQRLEREIGKRPLIKTKKELKNYVTRTLSERIKYYCRADLIYHQSEELNTVRELTQYLKRF